MPRAALLLAIVGYLTLTCLAQECPSDHREHKTGGIVVKDVTISGTQNLTSDELLQMSGSMIGACFNDDSEEIGERLRAQFQDRGYFGVEVKSVRFKPLDPLANPKPVVVEAEVTNGPQFRLRELVIQGNRGLPADTLRQAFSFKMGDIFERAKVATGLERLREIYGKHGYLDSYSIPETRPASNGTMALSITVNEGPQYHMGKLEIVGEREIAARLREAWKLPEGAVYDQSYIDSFIEANGSLLPNGFKRDDVATAVNCPEEVVNVRMVVDPAKASTDSKSTNVPCKEKEGDSKKP